MLLAQPPESADPVVESRERHVEGVTDRDPQALAVERVVALGAEQHAVHAERRRVAEEKPDVVDVADVLAAKQRDRSRWVVEGHVDPRSPIGRSTAQREQAAMKIEPDDRLEHRVLGDEDRRRGIVRPLAKRPGLLGHLLAREDRDRGAG